MAPTHGVSLGSTCDEEATDARAESAEHPEGISDCPSRAGDVRDDIAKGLGDARKELREVRKDIQEFRREFEMPRVEVGAVEMPQVDMDKVADSAKKVADNARQGVMEAAEAAGLVKPSRSRRPFVLAGIATLGVVGFAMLNSPAVKTRLRDSAQRARGAASPPAVPGTSTMRPTLSMRLGPTDVKPTTYSAALDTSDSPFTEPPTELPEGLGTQRGTRPIPKGTLRPAPDLGPPRRDNDTVPTGSVKQRVDSLTLRR